MNDKFTIFSKVSIPPGCEREYLEKIDELTARSEAQEAKTLSIEWYMNEANELIVIDSYQDSDAFLEHVENVGSLSMAMANMATTTELLILGSPNETVRKILSPMGALFFDSVAGFTR